MFMRHTHYPHKIPIVRTIDNHIIKANKVATYTYTYTTYTYTA